MHDLHHVLTGYGTSWREERMAPAVPTVGTALAFLGWSTLALAVSAAFVLGTPVLVAMGLLRRLRAMSCLSACPG